MAHMKCVCFLRPTPETLDALFEELKEPRYGEYYLCEWASYSETPLLKVIRFQYYFNKSGY